MTEAIHTIAKLARRTAEQRVNVPAMIDWIDQNPTQFQGMLDSFDQVVDRFNRIRIIEIPDSLKNTKAIKEKMDQNLPTTSILITESESLSGIRFRSFVDTLKDVEKMMERGETTKEEPYLAYHTTKTDTQALVVGGLFHVYEEMLLRDPNLSDVFRRGQLVDALVEMLAKDRTNLLYDAVVSKSRLDWIGSWEGFTEEFRKANGFK